MRIINDVTIDSIHAVKLAHSKSRNNTAWFAPDNMSYWGTRVGRAVYGGRYFVTSDLTFDAERAYSIRELADDGAIKTVAFQVYATYNEAHKAAKLIAVLTQ